MKIISDFHDYYDVGMQYGIDPQLPYLRFRSVENLSYNSYHKEWFPLRRITSKYSWWHIPISNYIYIGFAGKVWCLKNRTEGPNPTFYYSLEEIEQQLILNEEKRRKGGLSNSRRSVFSSSLKYGLEKEKEHFDFAKSNHWDQLFDRFRTAIFVYKENAGVVINERLNLYGFQKILPPIQAFQELEMYVGSRLTKPVIEEPPISDKIKAEIHGFDKYSFRKSKKQ